MTADLASFQHSQVVPDKPASYVDCSFQSIMHVSQLCANGLVALLLSTSTLGYIFDLSGLDWTLRNQNGTIAIPASVPSQAHLDLVKAGIITEPLLGINGTPSVAVQVFLSGGC